jgi:hypothetical protein
VLACLRFFRRDLSAMTTIAQNPKTEFTAPAYEQDKIGRSLLICAGPTNGLLNIQR